jgi:hypothetical protein
MSDADKPKAFYLVRSGRPKKGLATNALLVQLYQPELLTAGPAAKVPSGKSFFAGTRDDTGAASPHGPIRRNPC